MSAFLEAARRALLAESKPLNLLPGVTVNVARTPVGPGLSAYMSLVNRRRENVWDKIKLSEEEQKTDILSKENAAFLNEALQAQQEEDSKDLIEALYWSVARLDPNILKEEIAACIDGGNQEKAISLLIAVNTFDRDALPKDQPQTGEAAKQENSTPATGATA